MVAAYAEMMFLGQAGRLNYTGHMIGLGVMAFSVCGLFLRFTRVKTNIITRFGRSFSWDIYAASSPVMPLLLAAAGFLPVRAAVIVQSLIAVPVYLVCLGLAWALESRKLRSYRSKIEAIAGNKEASPDKNDAAKNQAAASDKEAASSNSKAASLDKNNASVNNKDASTNLKT